MTNVTMTECANDFELWAEYVDPDGTVTEEQFDKMTEAEKIKIQIDCFGMDEFFKTLISAGENFGSAHKGNVSVYVIDSAYHGCWPSREFGWDAQAVKIEKNIIKIGVVEWDFDEDLEDPDYYDWKFSVDDFKSHSEFDIDDKEQAVELIEELNF